IAMSGDQFQELLHGRRGRVRATRLASALGCVGLLAFSAYFSRDSMGGDQVVGNAVAKANAFLETLDARQRGKALLEFDSAKKPSWSNLPVTMVPRNGLRLGELAKPQRAAALDALAAVLSKEGFQKVIDIMNADDQLVKGNDNRMRFGTENYYLAVFGAPSATKPWMLQFGGHHLGIKLVNMPDAEQQKQAVLGGKPKNLVLGPGQDGKTIRPEGLKCAALKEDQRATLLDLIGAWVHILPNDAAASRLAALKAKIDETYSVWYGPTTNGSAAYYRIPGQCLLTE